MPTHKCHGNLLKTSQHWFPSQCWPTYLPLFGILRVCYEKNIGKFYLSIWKLLFVNKGLQLFVWSQQSHMWFVPKETNCVFPHFISKVDEYMNLAETVIKIEMLMTLRCHLFPKISLNQSASTYCWNSRCQTRRTVGSVIHHVIASWKP